MIPCTEFIPCYSELFTFLEEKKGREEVERFWDYLFKPTGEGIPLINFVKKEGIRGCYSYWSGTLNEEAADFTLYLNEKAGWFSLVMHRCPSKGMLLELKEKIGITPYHSYCMHCDHYRAACEKVGLKYLYNFMGIEKASCSILIYDPKVFDGRVIVDENTEIMDRRAADNEYFHRDFHSSMNMAVEYLGTHYGKEGVTEFLRRYTQNVYRKRLESIAQNGLTALEEAIRDTYRSEKAEEVLKLVRTDKALQGEIAYCPAVRHLHETGREVSSWYVDTLTTVFSLYAERCGASFTLLSYDEKTGKASFTVSL